MKSPFCVCYWSLIYSCHILKYNILCLAMFLMYILWCWDDLPTKKTGFLHVHMIYLVRFIPNRNINWCIPCWRSIYFLYLFPCSYSSTCIIFLLKQNSNNDIIFCPWKLVWEKYAFVIYYLWMFAPSVVYYHHTIYYDVFSLSRPTTKSSSQQESWLWTWIAKPPLIFSLVVEIVFDSWERVPIKTEKFFYSV